MARLRTGDTEVGASDGRSTFHLVTTIADDIKLLVTKEIELARKELVGALTAKAVAVGAFAAAAFVVLLALIFGIQTAVAGLDNVFRPWASRLIVTVALLVLAGVAALFGLSRMKKPVTPKETKRTLKEGEEWARAQLRR